MNLNVIKFIELYNSDPALREKVANAEAMYPGSLEIREAVVEDVLIPIAEEMGLGFTLMDLFTYENNDKVVSGFMNKLLDEEVIPTLLHELTEEDLAKEDEDIHYWLVDKGWENDEGCFEMYM